MSTKKSLLSIDLTSHNKKLTIQEAPFLDSLEIMLSINDEYIRLNQKLAKQVAAYLNKFADTGYLE